MSEKEKDRQDEAREEESGFKVSDRRIFTPEGDLIGAGQETQKGPEKSTSPPESDQGGPKTRETPIIGKGEEEEKIDFASFILSLATSAMAYLGEVPDPATGKTVENLEGAKQMIDIISMLKEKTQGNLEAEESRLVENLLYELRMKYLSKAKVINL